MQGLINLYCNDCGNTGQAESDEKGFIFMVPCNTVFKVDRYDENKVEIVGHEPAKKLLEALFEAEGNIECAECGSYEVDMVNEAEIIHERNQEMTVENINESDILGGGRSYRQQGAPRNPVVELEDGALQPKTGIEKKEVLLDIDKSVLGGN